MTQLNNNQPLLPPNSPLQTAFRFGLYVRALIRIVFWTVVGIATIAAGFVALSGIWFAARIILQAVGLN